MGYGFAGHIGLSRETNWGSGTSATSYIEALSEDLTLSIDRFSHKAIIGSLAEPDDTAALRRVTGSVRFAAQPVALGHFLKGVLNTVSCTGVVSGTLMLNEFFTTAGGTDFSAEVPLQPWSFEVFRDVTTSVQYTGIQVDGLTLQVDQNAALMCEAKLIGRGAAPLAKTVPTFPGSPSKPFTFDSCSLSIGGAGTALIETLSIEINNNLQGLGALNLSTNIAKVRRSNHQMVTLRGTMDFATMTEYMNFVNQTEQAFTLSFTRANSFQLVVSLPRVVYTAFPLGIPGRERITVSMEGKAYFHTGSGHAIKASLTTINSYF